MYKKFSTNKINIFLVIFYNYILINYFLFQSIFLFKTAVLIKLIYDMKKETPFNSLIKLK